MRTREIEKYEDIVVCTCGEEVTLAYTENDDEIEAKCKKCNRKIKARCSRIGERVTRKAIIHQIEFIKVD